MSPYTGGLNHQLTNLDSVLTLHGSTHPSISVQLLITLAFVVLGLGSLETSSLLPLPLYGCWGSLSYQNLSGKDVCSTIALMDPSPPNDTFKVWACGSEAWWQPLTLGGVFLTIGRCLSILAAGVAADALGRRRSAIAWAGVYFVFAFVVSFAPILEVFVIGVTVQALCAQATTLSLILIASESSTQKESLRSGCLVLLGHSIGVGVLIPIVNTYIHDELYRGLVRTLPSVGFILFIFFLPESVRWMVGKGGLEHVPDILKWSHNVKIEETAKPKVAMVYHEMRQSLDKYGCKGVTLKQAISPLFLARPMLRIFLPTIFISALLGCAIGFRLRHDTLPYQSLEDRVISFGVSEIMALQVLGLVLARLPLRRVLVVLCAFLTAFIAFTRTMRNFEYSSCIGEVFFSSGGHFICVLTWVWFIMGLVRVTPTHSRGSILGLAFSFGTLGHSYSYLIHNTLINSWDWPDYFIAMLFSSFALLAGIIALSLPTTPDILPDSMPHLAPHLHWPETNRNRGDHIVRNDDTRL